MRDETSLRSERSAPATKTYATKHGSVATMRTENIAKWKQVRTATATPKR